MPIALTNAIDCTSAVPQTGNALLLSMLEDAALRNIHVNNDGTLSFQQEGIGLIPISPRFGFDAVGSIWNDEWKGNVLNYLRPHAKRFALKTISTFNRNKACSNCEFMPACAYSGQITLINTLGKILDEPSGNCPIAIKPLMESIKENKSKYPDYAEFGDNPLNWYVQRGFENKDGFDASRRPPNPHPEVQFNVISENIDK